MAGFYTLVPSAQAVQYTASSQPSSLSLTYTCTVSYGVSPSGAGSTSGPSSFTCSSGYGGGTTISATPASGYQFGSWSVTSTGLIGCSSCSSTSLNWIGSGSTAIGVTANFVPISNPTITTTTTKTVTQTNTATVTTITYPSTTITATIASATSTPINQVNYQVVTTATATSTATITATITTTSTASTSTITTETSVPVAGYFTVDGLQGVISTTNPTLTLNGYVTLGSIYAAQFCISGTLSTDSTPVCINADPAIASNGNLGAVTYTLNYPDQYRISMQIQVASGAPFQTLSIGNVNSPGTITHSFNYANLIAGAAISSLGGVLVFFSRRLD